MNAKRVAALHRELASLHAELAEAYDQPEDAPKPKRRPLAAVPAPSARPEVVDKVRRNLRRQGIAS